MAAKVKIKYVTNFEYCDKNHFQIIKGISILAALFAYICNTYMGISWLKPLQQIAAALFLFCSGFGVAESYRRKRGLVHYWENKAIKVWIPSLVSMILMNAILKGNLITWIASSPLGVKGNLLYMFFGCYAAFWPFFFFLDNKAVRCIGLCVVAVIVGLFITDDTYIALLPCFPLGVIYSQYNLKYQVRTMTAGMKWALTLVYLILAAGGWALGVLTEIPYLEVSFNALTYLFGAMFILNFVYAAKEMPIFGIFTPFGFMAYGIYLFYDKVLMILKDNKTVEMYALVILLLLVVAAVYAWLCKLLVDLNRTIRRRNSIQLKGSMW